MKGWALGKESENKEEYQSDEGEELGLRRVGKPRDEGFQTKGGLSRTHSLRGANRVQ